MIEITKLNNSQIIINCELIESVVENPDTTITMINGKKYLAKETIEDIINKTIEFKRICRG